MFWSTPESEPRHPTFVMREWEQSCRAVKGAVEHTGGTYRPASRGTDAFKAILEDFRSSYLLRYTPRGVAAPGWHEIKIKVTRPGSFTIRARKGYEGI